MRISDVLLEHEFIAIARRKGLCTLTSELLFVERVSAFREAQALFAVG